MATFAIKRFCFWYFEELYFVALFLRHSSLGLTATRHSAAMTSTAGSLPDKFSWQPFHACCAAPLDPTYGGISGSLGNPYLAVEALERAHHHLRAPQSSIMQPPPYYVSSSSAQSNFGPVLVSSHSHRQPWEPRATWCIHQPVQSCSSQQCPASQSPCSTQCSTRPDTADTRVADATTPLLANSPYVCLCCSSLCLCFNSVMVWCSHLK